MGINYSPKIVTDGLVLCLDAANPLSYPGTGNTWYNLSSNQNNATIGNPIYSLDNKGNLIFDGINNTGNLGNVLNIGTDPFALEFFAKKTSGGDNYSRVAAKGTYLSDNWSFYFGWSPNTDLTSINFFWGNPVVSPGSVVVDLDKWYHAVATRDTNNLLSLYVNNNLIGQITTTHNFNTSQNYRIACNASGGEKFKGCLALWRQYNKGLSPDEIRQNYLATKGRFGL